MTWEMCGHFIPEICAAPGISCTPLISLPKKLPLPPNERNFSHEMGEFTSWVTFLFYSHMLFCYIWRAGRVRNPLNSGKILLTRTSTRNILALSSVTHDYMPTVSF